MYLINSIFYQLFGWMNVLKLDKLRGGAFPIYQYFFRKASSSKVKLYYKFLLKIACFFYHAEIYADTKIGPGLYIGHPYGVTINPRAIWGKNVNIHKGVTIGQENRGGRKGAPIIGDEVWIGVNSTVVGKIIIGNDVLIASNSFVNRDVPSHSIVFGNPCVVKHRDDATSGYINRKV